jgi:hypothetical protein
MYLMLELYVLKCRTQRCSCLFAELSTLLHGLAVKYATIATSDAITWEMFEVVNDAALA